MTSSAIPRVLVTGATGFVGRRLVTYLRESQMFDVRSAVRSLEKNSGDAFESIQPVVVGNIDDTTDWAHALHGVNAVAHLAARVHVMNEAASNPLEEFRRVNVEGTLALARQAIHAGVQRFVYVSSIKVNGERGNFTERDTPSPVDPYGASKHEAETQLRALAAHSSMSVVIVRPPLVYGAGVKANFRALFNAVQKGIPLPLGAIHNKRSLIFVDNLSHFIRTTLTDVRAENETFLVSDGNDLSTADLVREMSRALGRNSRLLYVPPMLMKGITTLLGKQAVMNRLLDSLQVDITKARTLLEWTPPFTVHQGLRSIVDSWND